jgi:hypothetical protein
MDLYGGNQFSSTERSSEQWLQHSQSKEMRVCNAHTTRV